jgi:AcrR family transcriptional regulator
LGVAERRYRQKEEVRNLILDTAWKQIEEVGVQALSIRKVAEAIEYSIPVIYSHFDSKEAILNEFVKKGFNALTQQISKARDAHEKPAEKVMAMALAYWDFAAGNREAYQLMFGLGIPSCSQARSMPEIQAFSEVVKTVLQEAIASGAHSGSDVFLKFQSYWSILHGIISIRLMGGHAEKEREELDLAVLKDTITGFIYALI